MMKQTFYKVGVVCFLGLGAMAYAQEGTVGINSSTNEATLDVRPNATNIAETATTNEGIMAPRLSKNRVNNIANPKSGTLVYVSDITTALSKTATAAVVDITSTGYYYYDTTLTKWVKAGMPVGTAANQVLKWDTASKTWVAGTDANNTYTASTSVLLSGNSFQRAALTGDVTAEANKNTLTIANGVVTGAKIANGTITADKLAPGVLSSGSGSSGNIYSENGTLSSARTVSQNGNKLTFNTGEVALGNKKVPAELEVVGTFRNTGGYYVNTKVLETETEYEVKEEDYFISVNGPTNSCKIKVPNPASTTVGRILIITNKTSSNVAVHTVGGVQAVNGSQSPSINLTGTGMIIINDGKNWFNLINY